MTQFNSKGIRFRRKQAFVQFHVSIYGKKPVNTYCGHSSVENQDSGQNMVFVSLFLLRGEAKQKGALINLI